MIIKNMRLIVLLIVVALLIGPVVTAEEERAVEENCDMAVTYANSACRFYAQSNLTDEFNPGMNQRRLRQPRGRRGPDSRWAPESPRDRKYLEQFRLLKLMELLDMDDDQEVEFIVSFRSYRKALRKLAQERNSVIKELSRKAKRDKIAKDDVGEVIVLLEKNDLDRAKTQREFISKATDYLSPAQLGKLLLFQEKFELELLEAVRGFRRRGMHAPDWNHDDSVNRRTNY